MNNILSASKDLWIQLKEIIYPNMSGPLAMRLLTEVERKPFNLVTLGSSASRHGCLCSSRVFLANVRGTCAAL